MRTLLVLCLVACGASESKPRPDRSDEDPSFVHVDRDQLAALCLSRKLPAVTWPSMHGALSLANGERVPWLTVWVSEQAASAQTMPFVRFTDWKVAVKSLLEDGASRGQSARATNGRVWLTEPCSRDEMLTVVTGVFFQADGAHVVAARGTQLVEESLPANAEEPAVFKKAFELTEKLLGQEATIATMKLVNGEQLTTVQDNRWQAAAK